MADASRLLSSAVRCAKPKKKTYSSRRTLCSRPGLFFLPPVPFRTMPSERSSTVFRVWSSACGGQLHPALVRRRTHAMVLDRPRRSARRRACRLRSPSPPVVKNLQTSHCSNRPRRWVSATQEKKKKHETGARSIDVVLKSAGPCPFGPPSSCRCRAALRVYLVCLVCSSLYFRSIDGRSSNFDRRLEGRGKQKKCCFGFWGGWRGLQKKKKRRVFYTPREWTAPTEAAEPARDPGPLSKQLFRKTL